MPKLHWSTLIAAIVAIVVAIFIYHLIARR